MSLGWRKRNPSGPQFSGHPSTGKPLRSPPEQPVEVHSTGVAFLILALDFFACE